MKIRLPLTRRTVANIPCPYPRVVIQVRDRYGLLAPLPFRIDPGADCTAVPVSVARKENIIYQQTVPGIAAGLVGAAVKIRDRIKLVIAGREYDWPCDFIDVPPAVPGRRPDPLQDVAVLGRAGFLDEFALTIDSGYLILTRRGPLRQWFRHRLHGVWQALGMVHPSKEPL